MADSAHNDSIFRNIPVKTDRNDPEIAGALKILESLGLHCGASYGQTIDAIENLKAKITYLESKCEKNHKACVFWVDYITSMDNPWHTFYHQSLDMIRKHMDIPSDSGERVMVKHVEQLKADRLELLAALRLVVVIAQGTYEHWYMNSEREVSNNLVALSGYRPGHCKDTDMIHDTLAKFKDVAIEQVPKA